MTRVDPPMLFSTREDGYGMHYEAARARIAQLLGALSNDVFTISDVQAYRVTVRTRKSAEQKP